MRDKPSLNRNITLAPFDMVLRSLLEFYLLLIVDTLFLLNGLFIIVICACMNTTACVIGAAPLTYFLVMRLNIIIAPSCNSLVVIVET